MQLPARGHDQTRGRFCLAAAVPALPVARQARASPGGVAMGTEAGAVQEPRRVGAVHARLFTMHHDELRRARAHAAAVARKLIAVAALLALAARPQPQMEEIVTAT